MNSISRATLLAVAASAYFSLATSAHAQSSTEAVPEKAPSAIVEKSEESVSESSVNSTSQNAEQREAERASDSPSVSTASEEPKETQATTATKPEVVKPPLRIASWGGAYGQAQIKAIIRPAEEQLSIAIERVELEASNSTDQKADVLELRQAALLQGCKKGEYLRRTEISLAPARDGSSPEADYFVGGLSDCGVASFAWSSLILFDRSKFKKRKPNKLSDVFDVKRFKGKRAFLRNAENLVETLALVSLKGVTPQTVYEALAERENRDKVFARLEALLPHIVWVDTPTDALAKLESGEVRFAAGFSGRAFRKTIAGNFAAIWDGHVYDYLSWAISSRANDKELAKKFVELATAPARLVDQAKQWPYGPMRKSAAASVGRHATLDIELAPFMPTSDLRISKGIRRDPAFWQEHGTQLNDRVAALLEGFPRGVRIPPPTRRPAPPPKEEQPKQDN